MTFPVSSHLTKARILIHGRVVSHEVLLDAAFNLHNHDPYRVLAIDLRSHVDIDFFFIKIFLKKDPSREIDS